jgi:hypothetical protein
MQAGPTMNKRQRTSSSWMLSALIGAFSAAILLSQPLGNLFLHLNGPTSEDNEFGAYLAAALLLWLAGGVTGALAHIGLRHFRLRNS